MQPVEDTVASMASGDHESACGVLCSYAPSRNAESSALS